MLPLPLRIRVGSGNAKKVVEIRAMLSDFPVPIVPWDGTVPDVVEDADTFVGNARKKALELSAACGDWVLADDSGLEVDVLNGAPGVRSHRYAGEPPDDDRNNDKLLRELAGVPMEKRTARFRCALALAKPGEVLLVAEGECPGRVLTERRGHNDFGYDPLFLYEPFGETFAQLPPERKHQVSHRAHALRALREQFRRRFEA